jgi:hypothetical protein
MAMPYVISRSPLRGRQNARTCGARAGGAGIERLINWYVAREHGIALYGPAPATLIDPISGEELV